MDVVSDERQRSDIGTVIPVQGHITHLIPAVLASSIWYPLS